ncbi:hypothetical protein CUMW_024810 [Citrus unshiu]|nr:hypothetical protein CUMW_024810 [Citrus unshiu]
MAAFSPYQEPTFVFDSFLVPTASNKMRSNAVEGTTFGTKTYFAPMLANECSQEIPLHAQIHETRGLLDHNTEVATGEHQVSQMVTSMEEKNMRNIVDIKKEKERKYNIGVLKKPRCKKQKKLAEEAASPSGYVHVRARRGQATDSHSLAERVRRAKISARMKLLQSLVPGCEKITGKALILDEIIKYVRTLQTQLEFLAAKLASVTPMFSDSGVDFTTSPLAHQEDNNGNLLRGNDHDGRIQELANADLYELVNFQSLYWRMQNLERNVQLSAFERA